MWDATKLGFQRAEVIQKLQQQSVLVDLIWQCLVDWFWFGEGEFMAKIYPVSRTASTSAMLCEAVDSSIRLCPVLVAAARLGWDIVGRSASSPCSCRAE